ncbi:DUF58 domain-containing protein [Guyparkeria halophila]|uniref:DUF58 domain-containing protein n=1 Tax=Guyparkeria halophila TaxID=47960 RepID=A0ABZ0YT97_9GAMM|nr:DUF58 domain-containing protein [Guyparkeria halophila]WQH15385.1 DUF58 domain-containing protein [Guyparkeria halophila]
MTQQTLSPLQIRPRRFGLGLAIITTAMLLAAINYGNNLIFLIAFMMIALIINSAWQGWRALSAVQPRVIPPGMRAAGEPGTVSLELTSRATLPPLQIDAGLEETAVHTDFSPAGATTVAMTLPGEPRGYLPLPDITLATPYPLGLWTIRRSLSPTIGQWVHPAPVEGIDRGQRTESDDSGDQASLEGDPTRLRSYHPGDPIRHVVFRHYAKTGHLLTRHPEADSERPDPELIDYAAFAGPRETRLSAMTERLMALNRAQRPWVLRLPGEGDLTASASANLAQRYQTALQRLARFGRERDAQGFDHPAPGETV